MHIPLPACTYRCAALCSPRALACPSLPAPACAVGQFRELVETAERNKALRETLKQVRCPPILSSVAALCTTLLRWLIVAQGSKSAAAVASVAIQHVVPVLHTASCLLTCAAPDLVPRVALLAHFRCCA